MFLRVINNETYKQDKEREKEEEDPKVRRINVENINRGDKNL